MIIADEDIDSRIIKALRNMAVEVISIAEHYSGISDEDVIQLAQETKRIILTEDKDFW